MNLKPFASEERLRSATINLYFSLEHIVKAFLASIGIEPKSHEVTKIFFILHSIKPRIVPLKVAHYLGNFYEKSHCEYNISRRNGFTKNEVSTYLAWFLKWLCCGKNQKLN